MSALEPLRICMWSGPRNISTAMMRSFENRPDTGVVDEPFYAAYLHLTGLDHPMRDEVLQSQPTDWRAVVATLTGPAPGGAAVFYQKHMTHHMLPDFGLDWMAGGCNVFLIRAPARVLSSYVEKRDAVDLADIGVVRQSELFAREADRLGHAPIVVESADVLARPQATLSALCQRIGIPFTPAMLSWPTGPRDTDGVWAPAWYDQVEMSTGFSVRHDTAAAVLPDHLQRIADVAEPFYQALAAWKLEPDPA